LSVLENRVLRKIFEPKRKDVAGDLRRLQNEEIHNLYASPNIRVIKSREMVWTCSTHGRAGKDNILVGKPKGTRPLRRPRHRWKDNTTYILGK